ncbi:MAG TPA: MerR family transcriptional regulator [Chitinophagales bacterium]|nr:MerR family transcriptional regulator [Chitinophagales bacterium]
MNSFDTHMAHYSIKEVETLTGVKAHTLRIWEQRYHLLKPRRTKTNIRYYTDEQLRLLLNIGTLNRSGMKISKIAGLTSEQMGKEVLVLHNTPNSDNLLDSMIHCMLDFDERRFEKILSNAIMKIGFEATVTRLIFPFLNRTGVLWATGSVKVVQEHYITNLIRRKILVATDAQPVEPNAQSKKFVLFLPEQESHELLLLFTEYLLRKNNHEVAYIGARLPVGELAYIYQVYKPDYLVTFLTAPLEDTTPAAYCKKLSTMFPQCKIVTGGVQMEQVKGGLPSNCVLVRSQEDLLGIIS